MVIFFWVLPQIEPRLLSRRPHKLVAMPTDGIVAVPTELLRLRVNINAVYIMGYVSFIENVYEGTEATSFSEQPTLRKRILASSIISLD